ncbi:flagellar hook-associated protein FlgK [Vibrio sp. SS-MA-C1-2]|uniref:flagellar hook-associated protein FlgK n=1 Tax=Vibrio sp. SS-MA-C1-2 TaxID=2908646 RepID=UPI001F48E18A|nr:flagellar hook-associated protein FlgK [Vibrio sp. SS-MA-C1-2]UJF18025.1 flagellar hook-associated protein FlgK [Vibrio sp. SS-MA-C1-2]
MSMINIGLTGVLANQIAMNTTAQNTANVNTEGYSRQEVTQSALILGGLSNLNIGSGVTVDSIRRVADQALVTRLETSSAELSYSNHYYSGMSGLEELLGSESLNLTNSFNDFFASVDEATVAPESPAYREQILAAANGVASTFNRSVNAIEEQMQNLNNQFSVSVSLANAQLENISQLNISIKEAHAKGQSTAGLTDQLDLSLRDLTENMGVNVLRKGDGTAEVSLPDGQPLVIGESVASIERVFSNTDPYGTELTLNFSGASMPVNEMGGTLGALIKLKEDEYEPNTEKLNELAEVFATAVNDALATGIDLEGNVNTINADGTNGSPLFQFNALDPAASLEITDISAEQLALSTSGEIGDGGVLTDITSIITTTFTSTTFSNKTIYDTYSQMLGELGINTNQAQQSLTTAQINQNEAQAARDNVSAVNSDEEAANLMMYMNAYQANMKVVSAANQMFQSVLTAF